jgi:O-antigen ligase
MFVVLSIFIALESISDKTLNKKNKIGWIIISIFLIVSIYFITSRAGILATLLLLCLYFLYKIKRSKSRKLIWIFFLLIFVISLPLFKYNEKVFLTVHNLIHNNEQINKNQDERIIVWESALNIIKANFPFGVGIGDVGTELVKEYDLVGAKRMSELRYNAHNQFLEVWLESGVIGFLVFVGLIITMIYIAIIEKNLLLGLFLISMIIFFSFETILYRFAGVSFFSLFSFLLLHVKTFPNIINQSNA